MSIFSRRRLQAMLNDLGPLLTAQKANDLVARLEHKRTEQAIATEYELAMSWAVSRNFSTEIEPDLFGSRPDLVATDLFSRPTVIEVTALSDVGFSGENDMRRAANILTAAANRIKKGSGKHLYFTFPEHRVMRKGKSMRERRVTADFALSNALEQLLAGWLVGAGPGARLQLEDQTIGVVVEWKPYVHPLFNFFSSMPAIADDLEDNVLFKALKSKAKGQLKEISGDYLRCVFVCDAGCRLLDAGFRTTRRGFEFSGEEIIYHFLKRKDVDIICVFAVSPWQPRNYSAKPRHWVVNARSQVPLTPAEDDQLRRICASLPRPHLSGYQARSRHLQGMFRPDGKGQYLGTTTSTSGVFGPVKFKMSVRALQEYLAGRLDQKYFSDIIGGEKPNQFAHLLDTGYQISAARIEPGGLDEDDDQIELTFSFDPAASKLLSPKGKV